MRRNALVAVLAAIIVALLLRPDLGRADAQSSPGRHPIDITVARTKNDNYLLYRMWSDGSIDVRLTNPIRDQLTFQEGWRAFQRAP